MFGAYGLPFLVKTCLGNECHNIGGRGSVKGGVCIPGWRWWLEVMYVVAGQYSAQGGVRIIL